MKLDQVATVRVAAAFTIVLIFVAIYIPYVGIPLAVLWAGIVIWQYIKQRTTSDHWKE